MSKITKKVDAYISQYACDDCEKIPNPGCMLELKHVLTRLPPIYVHECPNCRKEYKLDDSYPRVFYE